MWFLRGKANDKIILPIQEIMVKFVYSRQQIMKTFLFRIMARCGCKWDWLHWQILSIVAPEIPHDLSFITKNEINLWFWLLFSVFFFCRQWGWQTVCNLHGLEELSIISYKKITFPLNGFYNLLHMLYVIGKSCTIVSFYYSRTECHSRQFPFLNHM